MTLRFPFHHLTFRKRFSYLIILSTLLCFFLGNLFVFILSSPRSYNHFIFKIKQPIRYLQQWNTGYPVQNVDCALSEVEKSFSFEDISSAHVPNGSIFFIETSCRHGRGVELSARQACSIESAAKMNPARVVFVLIISSVQNRTLSPVIETLLEYRNIKLVQVNLDRYFASTPLHKFYREDKILTSLWPLSHMSDLLRYVTLYKYGGTYLDLDFLVIQSLESLHNYAGAESDIAVAAGIIHLDPGHWLAGAALRELEDHFSSGEWGANGPGVLTRLLKRECDSMSYSQQVTMCSNFTVYPPPYFYPVHWTHWRDYFNVSDAPSVMHALHNSYAAHVWNSFTKKVPVLLKTDQPYAQLARRFCPKITALANDSF